MSAGAVPLRQRFEAEHLGLLLLVQTVWGLNWITSKLAVDAFHPLLMVALRFGITFACVFPFLRWHPQQMRNLIIGCLLTGPLSFATGFISLGMATDIAPLAVASNLGVPFATLLSALFLGDKIGIWRGSALFLAFGGVLFMGFDPTVFQQSGALALQALSAFFWAAAAIFLRKVQGVAALETQAWVSLLTWPVLGLGAMLFEPHLGLTMYEAGWTGWGSLAVVVFGATLFGHSGFFWLLRRYPIPLLAPFLLLAPIIGAIAGALFFGHAITWRMVVGGLLTLSGVLIITLREAQKRAKATVQPAEPAELV
jgi:O-acetylserine/cysteine efflux transporter